MQTKEHATRNTGPSMIAKGMERTTFASTGAPFTLDVEGKLSKMIQVDYIGPKEGELDLQLGLVG